LYFVRKMIVLLAHSNESRPDGLDQKLFLMPQQKTIILRT
jgi:hypothetical protein